MSRNLRDGRRVRGRPRRRAPRPSRRMSSCVGSWPAVGAMTPWRTAAVVSCASARVAHLGRRTALSLFSYLTPHTRRVLGGGFLCGAHRQAFACLCMRGRGRKLVAIQTEAHARCVICALVLLGVAWPAASSDHGQGIATARSGQRQDRIRRFLLSCSRPAAT
jgi:hypothetical protein